MRRIDCVAYPCSEFDPLSVKSDNGDIERTVQKSYVLYNQKNLSTFGIKKWNLTCRLNNLIYSQQLNFWKRKQRHWRLRVWLFRRNFFVTGRHDLTFVAAVSLKYDQNVGAVLFHLWKNHIHDASEAFIYQLWSLRSDTIAVVTKI